MAARWILSVLLCFSFGITVAAISMSSQGRFQHRAETVENQSRLLAGQPNKFDGEDVYFGAWQNRVMFPLGMKIIAKSFQVRDGQAYIILRCLSAIFALFTFSCLLNYKKWMPIRHEVLGASLISFALIQTFNEAWEVPSDFGDVAIISLLVIMALRQFRIAFLLVCLIGAFNRESAAYGGLIWIAIQGFGNTWVIRSREVLFGFLGSLVSYAVAFLLKYFFGGVNAISAPQTWTGPVALFYDIQKFIAAPSPFDWPTRIICLVIVFGALILAVRSMLEELDYRLMILALLLVLPSLLFAHISEIRQLIPTLVLIGFVALRHRERIDVSSVSSLNTSLSYDRLS